MQEYDLIGWDAPMRNNEAKHQRKRGSVKKDPRGANVICRKSRKRNIPQTEEFPAPCHPDLPHEDDCLMQED